jgi:CheY-like chemotaxis protein/HPt (histidine-containing phosphotransfer) domain-containing protein
MSNPFHILVADDNDVNQQVLAGMLKHAGYTVGFAHDGQETIQSLSATRYDLLILDCMMPVMDGFEAARLIRSSDGSCFDPNIPILAVTALSTKSDQERCLECGMNDFITKPVDAHRLFSRVKMLLEDSEYDVAGASTSSDEETGSEPAKERNSSDGDSVDIVKIVRAMSARIIRDAEQWIPALIQLRESGDFHRLAELVHKIRGTGDLLKDSRLSTVARELEDRCKAGADSSVGALANELATELKRVVSELEQESASG